MDLLCVKCGKLGEFYPDSRGKPRRVCKVCYNARRSALYFTKKAASVPDPNKTPPGAPTFEPDFEIIEEYPVAEITPEQIAASQAHPDDTISTKLRRVLLIPDTHAPYHDEKAFQLMLRAGRVLQPDIVVVLGDFADFYAVSSHSKNPERAADLEYEVGIVKEKIREVEKLNAGTNVYVAGNHEDRLSRYLSDRAPALFKTVQIPEVLELKERWHYVPYKATYRLGKVHITHDVGTAGRNANRQAMDAFQGSAIIGHTHRMEYSVIGRVDGPPTLGVMLGWLGDFSKIDYMHQVKARRDWVHGFGIGFLEPDGILHVQPVPIVNDRVCIMGQVIR